MADTNIFAMADTWNNAATIFTAIQMNVTDTASQAASLLMDLQVGGASKFNVGKTGIVTATGSIATSGNLVIASDVLLVRDDASTLAQRNGTNPQTQRLYNTYTDASNYERFLFGWSGNEFFLGTEAAGTGTGGRNIRFQTGGTTRWYIAGATGHWLALTDATYDIGASGANRPRNIYLSGQINAGNGMATPANVGVGIGRAVTTAYLGIGTNTSGYSQINFSTGVAPTAPNNGDIWFDGTNLKMQIGGVTKTFTLT
jgi:hypothetical protein